MTILKLEPNNATSVDTILAALQSHVSEQGDAVAFAFPRSETERIEISYCQLGERARRIACGLLPNAKPSDRAQLMYPAGLEFIEAFLRCLYAAIIVVPAYLPKRNSNAERIHSIAADCTHRLLLCTSDTKRNVDAEFARSVKRASVMITHEVDSGNSGTEGRALRRSNILDCAIPVPCFPFFGQSRVERREDVKLLRVASCTVDR